MYIQFERGRFWQKKTYDFLVYEILRYNIYNWNEWFSIKYIFE